MRLGMGRVAYKDDDTSGFCIVSVNVLKIYIKVFEH